MKSKKTKRKKNGDREKESDELGDNEAKYKTKTGRNVFIY